jgi:hypothetical protein
MAPGSHGASLSFLDRRALSRQASSRKTTPRPPGFPGPPAVTGPLSRWLRETAFAGNRPQGRSSQSLGYMCSRFRDLRCLLDGVRWLGPSLSMGDRTQHGPAHAANEHASAPPPPASQCAVLVSRRAPVSRGPDRLPSRPRTAHLSDHRRHHLLSLGPIEVLSTPYHTLYKTKLAREARPGRTATRLCVHDVMRWLPPTGLSLSELRAVQQLYTYAVLRA